MANKRIKDISTASTSFASDDFVITDSATSGTRKMTKDNLISQVSAGVSGDYLEESNNLSDVASTSTAMENLKIPSIGSEPHQSPLNLHLGSMAYLDSAAPNVGTLHSDGLARMSNTGGDVALWAESTNANVMIVNVIGASPNYIFDVRDDDVSKFRIDGNGNVVIGSIPTSASGLASGTVWSDSGTLKIVS
ncbi:putative uncharacterized domain protein [uncultured Mediterranean phage uvMED]|uniref:Uncharacterized protein n=1 Tax=uncultured organism MedDCM-OCT-S04-C6 TaxID=743618 RepID=D6PK68_9ZZZZ|nr:hypothetical protein [uncultured organism MedDCM-OCT-S04-C6]BAQ84344.1 putative uncharacterized domain protein [uncultured Mediterranean phage uvMED]BAQ84427.1 putative uncharacterized domain protein [uncultured Mediterranean phage uvMED]BAQ84440.1 putative uncharacterized domain protein [uncultured Mediterranean phage uvMED]BAQ84509.1 putative uncharacterized domain protein [uncultured Mediterranean phage uvMED]